jgi:hypothetical protein
MKQPQTDNRSRAPVAVRLATGSDKYVHRASKDPAAMHILGRMILLWREPAEHESRQKLLASIYGQQI